MFTRVKETYDEFPRTFWALVGASFIDRLGGTMIFPFFALYVTQKFNVGMTQAGVLLAIFSIAGLVGSVIGGALTDKLGRRGMIIFGLVFSALSSVSMGLVEELSYFYLLAIVVGSLERRRPRAPGYGRRHAPREDAQRRIWHPACCWKPSLDFRPDDRWFDRRQVLFDALYP